MTIGHRHQFNKLKNKHALFELGNILSSKKLDFNTNFIRIYSNNA